MLVGKSASGYANGQAENLADDNLERFTGGRSLFSLPCSAINQSLKSRASTVYASGFYDGDGQLDMKEKSPSP